MLAPPEFSSHQDYRAKLVDPSFWRVFALAALEQQGFTYDAELKAGHGGTYPVLIAGDLVIKFYGHIANCEASYNAEASAHDFLALDAEILAPKLLSKGSLFPSQPAPWPYLITNRMTGVAWEYANLIHAEKLQVATDLGVLLGRLHRLPASTLGKPFDWSALDLAGSAADSSFPAQLVQDVEKFVADVNPSDHVVTHSDIQYRHAFVKDGRLSGVIDWGDIAHIDRHYELAKLHLDLFECDPELLGAFLRASDWPMTPGFARKSLAMALIRQAQGLVEHPGSMDTFYRMPDLFDLGSFTSLEALADAWFAYD